MDFGEVEVMDFGEFNFKVAREITGLNQRKINNILRLPDEVRAEIFKNNLQNLRELGEKRIRYYAKNDLINLELIALVRNILVMVLMMKSGKRLSKSDEEIKKAARRWFNSPNGNLGGQRPNRVLRNGPDGLRGVESAVRFSLKEIFEREEEESK